MYWTLPLTCLVSLVTVSETLKVSPAHGMVAQGGSELYLHTPHLLLAERRRGLALPLEAF